MNNDYAWSPPAEPHSGASTPTRKLPSDFASVAAEWNESMNTYVIKILGS